MSAPTGTDLAHPAPELILARYGELWLKGKNRSEFERALARNVRTALTPITPVVIEREHGNLRIRPERRVNEATRRLQEVFGIASVSPAWSAPSEPEAIAALAQKVLRRALLSLPAAEPISFRVRTKRADKTFPLTSTELDRFVADHIEPEFHSRLRIDLSEAELTLGIQVKRKKSYVFAESLPGPGGLPTGSLGRVMCLLSGGIDSPVAAWLAMKRGCNVSFVTFHSYPFIGESAILKVRRLVRALARFQRRSVLFTVPFAEIQSEIRDRAPESYRTVLYRRSMHRIAERLAAVERARAVVTGDSLGQVASQTLQNIACIQAACRLPVLQPLISYDKRETVALARRIGTYDISIVPEPDCCTVFQPRRPVIHGRPELCLEAEAGLALDDLVANAALRAERLVIEP